MLHQALCPEVTLLGARASTLSSPVVAPYQPPRRESFPKDVLPELITLCIELVSSDPAARPNGRSIVERLAACASNSARAGRSSERISYDTSQVFVGRDAQLAELRELTARARRGQISAASICGRSGMGKTALVRHFLEEQQREEPAPLILMARCHEREALAYKAFDGIVDGLSFALSQLSREQLAGLHLADVQAVARLFPVLKQLPEIAELSETNDATAEALEQRRQAFDAFRELLTRLAQLTPIVLFIDDLQWADLDSAILLRHLVRPPNPPPVTWLVACREEELTAPVTSSLMAALSAVPNGVTQITIGALPANDIRELARRALGSENPAVDAVVREAAGVPIFAQELLYEVQRAPSSLTGERALPGLEAVISARLSRLSPSERALLDVVAIAAKPLLRTTARLVAGLDTTVAYDAEHGLIAKKLLRLGDGGQVLETYHDSIRELAARILAPAQLPRLHGELADVLLARGEGDPEDIAHHLKSAGALERAAEFAERAARRASSILAFGRAAALYRMAIELRPDSHPEVGEITAELAQALANAGRGLEAASAYERAASLLPAQSLTMTCKAAEQLLQSGDVRRGRAVVSKLLGTFGWRVPEAPWQILASIGLRRLQLSLRGFGHTTHSVQELSQQALVRLDASWALVSGLSLINTVYANYFQNHHMIYALAAGEPRRLLRALAAEAAHTSMAATPASRQRGFVVLDNLRRLAAAHPSEPIGEPMVAIGTALWAWMFGDWATCQVHAAHAAHLFRTKCTGVTWELGTARTFMLGTLIFLGRYNEYQRLWPELLEDARARGDMFAETKLVLIDLSHGAALANDQPEAAEREVMRALGMWNSEGFNLQEYWALYARVEIALYQGDAEKAWQLLEEQQRNIARSLLLRMKNLRIWVRQMRARAAIALAAQMEEKRDLLLANAAKDISALAREKSAWGDAMVTLLRGLSCSLTKESVKAASLLSEAAVRLDHVNMASYAAAARFAQSELLDGDASVALRADAKRQLVLLGVRNPRKLSLMLAPRERESSGPESSVPASRMPMSY
jgi:tetratricopeptide (TPR) repeat protein